MLCVGVILVQHFIKRYSRCSQYRTKTHDKSLTIFTISNSVLETQRDNIKKQGIGLAFLLFMLFRMTYIPRNRKLIKAG